MSCAPEASAAESPIAILVCGPFGIAGDSCAAILLSLRRSNHSVKYLEESITWRVKEVLTGV